MLTDSAPKSPGFTAVTREIDVHPADQVEDLKFIEVSARQQVTVAASVPAAMTPDPSERILVHDQLLDANPGRPGAPISIPGLPIETASGGVKAPQPSFLRTLAAHIASVAKPDRSHLCSMRPSLRASMSAASFDALAGGSPQKDEETRRARWFQQKM